MEEFPAMMANKEAEFPGLTGSVLAMTAVRTFPAGCSPLICLLDRIPYSRRDRIFSVAC